LYEDDRALHLFISDGGTNRAYLSDPIESIRRRRKCRHFGGLESSDGSL